MLRAGLTRRLTLALLAACAVWTSAEDPAATAPVAEVTAHLIPASGPSKATPPPAILWLNPVLPNLLPPIAPGKFTLTQKNKMFTPHLLVVPVGSSVAFPNADPYFHNVFSLFDGRRFDLGLYEAGSTRSVVFSREGVSYIFCNIHSEMSAVVVSLATPFYGFADAKGIFHVKDVPAGEYDVHVWIEGRKQSSLDRLTRRVRIAGTASDVGEIRSDPAEETQHRNKFGQPYAPDPHPIY